MKAVLFVLLMVGMVLSNHISINQTFTCFNSSTATGSCSNLADFGATYFNVSEPVGVPFYLDVNLTNGSFMVPSQVDISVYGQYIYPGGAHNVSIGLWNGSAYKIVGWLPTSAIGWVNFSYDVPMLTNISTISLRFNHSANGVAGHTGISIEYINYSLEDTNTITITYPTNLSTFGPNQCSTTVVFNETFHASSGADTCYLYYKNMTGDFNLVETHVSEPPQNFTNITQSGWYLLNCTDTFSVDGVNFSAVSNQIDYQVIGTSFCLGGTDNRPSISLPLILIGSALIGLTFIGGQDD